MKIQTYPEGIDELVEWEAVVWRWLRHFHFVVAAEDLLRRSHAFVLLMEQPELLVLQDDLLEVLERDDDRVDLAQFAQFEELDR